MNRHFRPSLVMPNIYLGRDPMDFYKRFRGLAATAKQAEAERERGSKVIHAEGCAGGALMIVPE